ncbi:MAG: WD40 repeat domain-containing protein [Planctomycetota bacterium]
MTGKGTVTVVKESGSKQVVERAGKQVGGEYDEVFPPIHSPAGEDIAFPARTGENWRMMRNGEPVGDKYDRVGRPEFSLDGSSLVFPARKDGEWFVVKDGKKASETYQQIGDLAVSHDGASVALVGWSDHRATLIKDGHELGQDLQLDDAQELCFVPGTDSVVCRAFANDQQFLVRDGKPITKRYNRIWTWAFGPRGKTLAFVAMTKDEKYVLLRNGQRLGEPFEAYDIRQLAFSPDSRHVAVPVRTGDGWVVILDGEPRGEPLQANNVVRLLFSPDGDQLAYAARSGKTWFVVKGGERLDGRYDNVSGLRNSEDGTELLFAGSHGGALITVRHPW